MSTKAITPRFAESLRLLAASQPQTQVSRSGTLDAGALGVMAVDAAVAAIVVGTRNNGDDSAGHTLLASTRPR
jgi:hypothetical protein